MQQRSSSALMPLSQTFFLSGYICQLCVCAGSAFAQLRSGAAGKPLLDFISDSENVRCTLTALRDQYCGVLAKEAALAVALEAEEGGEVCSLILFFSARTRMPSAVIGCCAAVVRKGGSLTDSNITAEKARDDVAICWPMLLRWRLRWTPGTVTR